MLFGQYNCASRGGSALTLVFFWVHCKQLKLGLFRRLDCLVESSDVALSAREEMSSIEKGSLAWRAAKEVGGRLHALAFVSGSSFGRAIIAYLTLP